MTAGFACANTRLTRGFFPRYHAQLQKLFWHWCSKKRMVETADVPKNRLSKTTQAKHQGMYQAGCYMGTDQHAWHMRELGDNKAQQIQ